MAKAYLTEYSIEFTERQWTEIWALSFEPFEINEGDPMTRGQWLAIAEMAIGKAELIRAGRYDGGEMDETWAAELREIADTILAYFKPGDGKL